MDKALLGINLNGILMGVFKKRIKPDKARELIMEDVEQYTQQISVDFAKHILSTNIESKLFEATWEDIFNEWKSNQEEK